jgi:hypothetical protein
MNWVTGSISARDIERQRRWSRLIFGPGRRTNGLIKHIRKELKEIIDDPTDLEEWVDIMILAIDGAWRHGASAEEIVAMYHVKMQKNRDRKWPDWRDSDEDHAIEHIR